MVTSFVKDNLGIDMCTVVRAHGIYRKRTIIYHPIILKPHILKSNDEVLHNTLKLKSVTATRV